MPPNATEAEQSSETSRAIRERAIEPELRRFYDDVAQEPIPKSYLELLRRIYDEDWIFPIVWAAEETPKPKLWQRLNVRVREFFLSSDRTRPNP